jgi:hypothetical protein
MAFQVSPGVNISEVDLTAGVQTVSLSAAGFAGPFQWGPALDVVNVGSEDDLVKLFGKPDANVYEYWFTAQSFLAYSNQLKVVRAISARALNSTADAKVANGTVSNTSSVILTGVGTSFDTDFVVGQKILIDSAEVATVNSITNATSLTVTTALANAVTSGTIAGYGVLIKNQAQHDDEFASGSSGRGLAAAKWPGDLGNSIKVSLCPSALAFQDANVSGSITTTAGNTTVTGSGTAFSTDLKVGDYLVVGGGSYQVSAITNATALTLATSASTSNTYTNGNWTRRWEYWSYFDGAPGTSNYASTRGGSNDELHMVVVDATGAFTGTPGTVLERYAYVSKASDAKTLNGDTNYYASVLNRNSAYVWWLAHQGTTTNWGSAAAGLSFGSGVLPYVATLAGGNDANESISDAEVESAWDQFANIDTVDVALLIAGPGAPSTIGSYIISNIAEVRKDCVAFVSPRKASVVSNVGNEVDDIVSDRNNLPSSSYAMMDSGWKYQYDKYNDVYRWVPLNGDIAGLAARTDTTNDPWYSPAGFTRGNIKNVVKLAFPAAKQSDRDDLYKVGVNAVVSFPGQGVILYGDKTLLSRPSAFDRINVRRLFIALEKTISRYAKNQLFEFNDEYTRAAFRNAVEPFLRDVKARRGITDFLVVCDGTNNTAQVIDANQFVGDIYVKPNRSINFIQLNFVAVRSGVSFQEVVGTV